MRILVVEDEDAMAQSLRAGLTAEGFAVDVAGDHPVAAEVGVDANLLPRPNDRGLVARRTMIGRVEEKGRFLSSAQRGREKQTYKNSDHSLHGVSSANTSRDS